MDSAVSELWKFIKGQQWLSPSELLRKIERAGSGPREDVDYRSLLLIRDSLDALSEHYGKRYVQDRVRRAAAGEFLESTWRTEFDDDTGFPSIKHRLMEPLSHDEILGFLRDLSRDVREPTSIVVGGSVALILRDLIVRSTEDIDVVNDIPKSIREMHAELDRLKERHRIYLGHFASHYLPEGWDRRTSSLGRFGELDVRLVDPFDVMIAKLFSLRTKDFDDLRAAWKKVDQEAFRDRLARTTSGLRSRGYLAEPSRRNWYVLTGEPDLPPLISE